MYILHKDTIEVFKEYLGMLTDNEKMEVALMVGAGYTTNEENIITSYEAHEPVEYIPDGVILKPQHIQEVLFPTNDY